MTSDRLLMHGLFIHDLIFFETYQAFAMCPTLLPIWYLLYNVEKEEWNDEWDIAPIPKRFYNLVLERDVHK